MSAVRAYLPSDYSQPDVLERLRTEFDRKRRIAERFAHHAASVNNSDVADHYAKEARVWAEAIDDLAVAIAKEQGR
jgi:ABC-type microcin C transport system permease subunit YejB